MKSSRTLAFVCIIIFTLASVAPRMSYAENAMTPVQDTARKELIMKLMTMLMDLQQQLVVKMAEEGKTYDVTYGPLTPPTSAAGTLNVTRTNLHTFTLSGTLEPPVPCYPFDSLEFLVNFGDNTQQTFLFADCKPINFSISHDYMISQIPLFPELILRTVEHNVWQNSVKARYMIEFTNPFAPTVKKLELGGQLKG